MNKVILMGRLVADPAVREAGSTKVAEYNLAVSRKGSDGADYPRCQAWDKKAEFAEKYLQKGTKVVVTGRIKTGSYKGRDGKTVYTTDVVVEDQEFAESKSAEKSAEKPAEKPAENEFMDVPDDANLPFN